MCVRWGWGWGGVVEITVFFFSIFGSSWWLVRVCILARACSPGIDGFTSPPKDAVKHLLTVLGRAE